MIRLPPGWVVFLCLLLFGCGELAGALLGGYPQPIMDWAHRQALTRPDIHGLVGVSDIDRTILAEVGTEALSRVHTFHLHAHGLALVVFVLSLVIVNMSLRPGVQKALTALVCLGLLYPFGWLTIVFALPFRGKSGAFRLAELLFFMPFGLTFLLSVWGMILLYFYKLTKRQIT